MWEKAVKTLRKVPHQTLLYKCVQRTTGNHFVRTKRKNTVSCHVVKSKQKYCQWYFKIFFLQAIRYGGLYYI